MGKSPGRNISDPTFRITPQVFFGNPPGGFCLASGPDHPNGFPCLLQVEVIQEDPVNSIGPEDFRNFRKISCLYNDLEVFVVLIQVGLCFLNGGYREFPLSRLVVEPARKRLLRWPG